jgi:hypothetical protein
MAIMQMRIVRDRLACVHLLSRVCVAAKVCTHTYLTILYMQMAKHPGFCGFKPRDIIADLDDQSAASVTEVQRKQVEYIFDTVCIPQYDAALAHKLNNTLAVCPLGEACPSRGSDPMRGAQACAHTFSTEFHVELRRCPNKDCGMHFVWCAYEPECAASAPNLSERAQTDTATLYSGKFMITDLVVFTAKCAGCSVTYFPNPIPREGYIGVS